MTCKICGTTLVCFDRYEHGGQKPGCPKCHILDETIMLSDDGEILFVDGTPFRHEDYGAYYEKRYQRSVFKGEIFLVEYIEATNEYRLKTQGHKFYYRSDELMEELRDAVTHINLHSSDTTARLKE